MYYTMSNLKMLKRNKLQTERDFGIVLCEIGPSMLCENSQGQLSR